MLIHPGTARRGRGLVCSWQACKGKARPSNYPRCGGDGSSGDGARQRSQREPREFWTAAMAGAGGGGGGGRAAMCFILHGELQAPSAARRPPGARPLRGAGSGRLRGGGRRCSAVTAGGAPASLPGRRRGCPGPRPRLPLAGNNWKPGKSSGRRSSRGMTSRDFRRAG